MQRLLLLSVVSGPLLGSPLQAAEVLLQLPLRVTTSLTDKAVPFQDWCAQLF